MNQYGPDWQKYGGYQPQGLAPGGYTPTASAIASTRSNPVAASTAGDVKPPNPYLQMGGLALGGVGTLLNAYGAYKQSEAMDEQAELQRRQFELEKALAFQDREASEEERMRNAGLQGGQYAQGMQDRSLGRYGEYNRRTGA